MAPLTRIENLRALLGMSVPEPVPVSPLAALDHLVSNVDGHYNQTNWAAELVILEALEELEKWRRIQRVLASAVDRAEGAPEIEALDGEAIAFLFQEKAP